MSDTLPAAKNPSDYQPHHMGDGKRFHVRTYDGGKFEVHGVGLKHVCDCDDDEVAEMIAKALEAAADIEVTNPE